VTSELHDEQCFTANEIDKIHDAARLIRLGGDRRTVLKFVGLAGSCSVFSFATLSPSKAFVPVFVRMVTVPGPIFLAALIPAAIYFYNEFEAPVGGTVGLELEDPFGLVKKRSKFLECPPKLYKFDDKEFEAETIGLNIFRARSDYNTEFDRFKIIRGE
jgi:hypothetical protein